MKKKSDKGMKMKKSRSAFLDPCVYSLILCAVCLVSFAWAWFSDEETAVGSIRIASYDQIVTIEDVTNPEHLGAAFQEGVWTLAGGSKYKITLDAKGDAQYGYCVISYAISQAAAINQISENVSESISEEDSEAVSLLYSDNISAGNTLSFHLTLEDEGSYVLTFTPCWGTPVISETDDSMILIENGDPVSMKADGSVKVADSEAGSGTEGSEGGEADSEAGSGTEGSEGGEADSEAGSGTEGSEGGEADSDTNSGEDTENTEGTDI